ncbi:MAG TPA: serine hydrolase, partial [Humisphaera sp.]
ERYFAGMTPGQPHQWASLSKSVTGLLAAILGHEGLLDVAPPVARYVPELAGTPFGEATVRQCLDMEAAADWPAGLTDLDWLAAAGLAPRPAAGGPVGVRAFVRDVPKACGRPHGSCFHYNNPAAEAVAWAIERAAGRPWHELVADRIWSRIGAEADASVLLDPTGVPLASGGMNATLRDLARLAEVVRTGGVAGGRQVLPAAAVAACVAPATNADRFAAGNIAAGRAGYGFRNLWYHANDADGSVVATGRFGQRAVINPKRGVVIAMLGAHPGRSDETADGVAALVRSILEVLPR